MEPSVRFELTAFSLPRRRSNHWSYEGSRARYRSRTRHLLLTGEPLSPDELSGRGGLALRAVTRCRPGPPAVRGQGHKPCATAQLPELDSNQHSVLQGHAACH
jgi:hypothetical protein